MPRGGARAGAGGKPAGELARLADADDVAVQLAPLEAYVRELFALRAEEERLLADLAEALALVRAWPIAARRNPARSPRYDEIRAAAAAEPLRLAA